MANQNPHNPEKLSGNALYQMFRRNYVHSGPYSVAPNYEAETIVNLIEFAEFIEKDKEVLDNDEK